MEEVLGGAGVCVCVCVCGGSAAAGVIEGLNLLVSNQSTSLTDRQAD